MRVVVGVVMAAALGAVGCVNSNSTPPGPSNVRRTHKPMWVTATWSGGRTGSPLNSEGSPPPNWFGLLCPANSLVLLNYSPPFNGLTIRNTCTASVTYALCVAAGSGNPGSLEGVPTCASPDVFATPTSSLSVLTLPNDGVTYINSTRSLTVNFFWCSDQTILAPAGTRGPSLTCVE